MGGYNFEDAILISERLSKDTFTSVHIEEFECVSRETKQQKNNTEITPNVNERKFIIMIRRWYCLDWC